MVGLSTLPHARGTVTTTQIHGMRFWPLRFVLSLLTSLELAVAVLGKNIWGGLTPHHMGGNQS